MDTQYLQLNGGPPAKSMAPFTQQRFSARAGSPLSIKLAGGVVYPTQSKLGIVEGSGCDGDLELILGGGEAFTGELPKDFESGEYTLCYCDAMLDLTLEPDVPSPEYPVMDGDDLTWRVERFTEGSPLLVDHPDRCETKCGAGCVGPSCYCESYFDFVAEGRPNMDAALCLPLGDCRALCAEHGNCSAFTAHVDEPMCWLVAGLALNETTTTPDPNLWIPEPGYACTPGDFATSSNVGKIVVTSRVSIGVDYVVTPDTEATLEVTGEHLKKGEKALLIPNYEKCGYGADERLPPVLETDPETSNDEVASFHGVVLAPGTYTLCFCDPEALPDVPGPMQRKPCSIPEHFTLTVGTVHASGLGCLFGAGGATKSCSPMPAGGFRCSDDDDDDDDRRLMA